MSVYFVQPECGGPIKIGHTVKPSLRLSGIRSHNHAALKCLAIIDGGREIERALHVRFSDFRLHGEWFRDAPELVHFISGLPASELPSQRRRYFPTSADRAAWFDLSIRSDKVVADRAGFPATTLRAALGKSGRGKRLSTEEARALGKRRAKNWDKAMLKPNRMPFAEAQVYLNDLSLTVDQAIDAINRVSRERIGPKNLKRYPTPWNRDFAYRCRRAKPIPLIMFPDRGAGRPRKPE